ncbi:excalibur calcium-binding domain-containing protein [Shewanella acanthi]|uniref:excalibur calcium-binding domain-containing protein n=1 Tax=Shewanella acanthi TaxID=2864212 RepID=UPI001C655564|nr:excalibur calcium-binding domain-containing protein [Shewanella acanthi]QYJ78393.1 excalibur calcium-binding domain-containing protein [Shewanella acanthi]
MEKGMLVRWNDDKGFGFIKPDTSEHQDVFIHISVLRHMARKPKVGDSIRYQAQRQNDGKVKAVIASIEGVAVIAASNNLKKSSRTHRNPSSTTGSFPRLIMPLFLIVGIGLFAYNKYQAYLGTPIITNEDVARMQKYETLPLVSKFQCESGKTYCSQMTSCEEATFYINHCPDTKMDGDGDGIPCESQWCGH